MAATELAETSQHLNPYVEALLASVDAVAVRGPDDPSTIFITPEMRERVAKLLTRLKDEINRFKALSIPEDVADAAQVTFVGACLLKETTPVELRPILAKLLKGKWQQRSFEDIDNRIRSLNKDKNTELWHLGGMLVKNATLASPEWSGNKRHILRFMGPFGIIANALQRQPLTSRWDFYKMQHKIIDSVFAPTQTSPVKPLVPATT